MIQSCRPNSGRPNVPSKDSPAYREKRARAIAQIKSMPKQSGTRSAMGDAQIKQLASDMTADMLKDAAREHGTVQSLEADVESPYHDPQGRAHFYDATLHPPGSSIQSTVSAFSSLPTLTESERMERLDWERAAYCGVCLGAGVVLDCGSINAFEQHNARVHNGDAMWRSSPDLGNARSSRVAPSSAGGDIRITNADPLGRTIVCHSPDQARREVERLGHQIADGPGAR